MRAAAIVFQPKPLCVLLNRAAGNAKFAGVPAAAADADAACTVRAATQQQQEQEEQNGGSQATAAAKPCEQHSSGSGSRALRLQELADGLAIGGQLHVLAASVLSGEGLPGLLRWMAVSSAADGLC